MWGCCRRGSSLCTVSVHKQAATLTPTLNQGTVRKGFLLSLEVSGLWLEEGQAIGSLFCAVGKLKGHLFCAAKQIGELEAKYLGGRRDSGVKLKD